MEPVTQNTAGPLHFSWGGLKRDDGIAVEAATLDAAQIARALSARSIIVERDAVIEEFSDRFQSVLSEVWPPKDPCAGYALHSSLGAYVIARVAVSMVPAGQISLRHEALKREGVIQALIEHGVVQSTARSILGGWGEVADDFKADRAGIDTSLLAGLAERTLTRTERASALSQVAYSSRCLARLAATVNLLTTVRALLPLLPSEQLGPRLLTAIAGLVLGRPERVLELLGDRIGGQTETLGTRTFAELAVSLSAFAAGELPELSEDDDIAMPALETTGPAFHEEGADEVTQMRPLTPAQAGELVSDNTLTDTLVGDEIPEDGEDVLDIVEERVDPEYSSEADPKEALKSEQNDPSENDLPKVAAWASVEGGTVDLVGRALLEDWMENMGLLTSLCIRNGNVLGLPLADVGTELPAVPPDPPLLTKLVQAEGGELTDQTERISIAQIFSAEKDRAQVLEPLYPPVRGAVRAIVAAAQGMPPTEAAIAQGGDLAWVLMRARAIALIVRGELAEAIKVVATLSETAAPERRWASDRLMRFEGRQQDEVPAEEARSVAADLLADLVQQLAGTISGAIRSTD